MTYEVRLEVFEGPLDLLLHLVSKERVDVAEVSISTITDEYLRTLKKMEEIDIDVASSFLVLAATLLELKSLKLLPGRLGDDPELAALLEERDHLLHRLIEYSTFKRAAYVVAEGLLAGRGYFPRIADIPEELIASTPDLLEGVGLEEIAAAARRALAPRVSAPVDTSFIAPIRVNVSEMIELLQGQVRALGTTSFGELCREAKTRIEVIVRFLALLELFRIESIELEQPKPFEEIVVRWREATVRRGA